MRIGAVSSINSIPNVSAVSAARVKHTQRTQPNDIVGRKLQNEITDKQIKKNELSSNATVPAREKATRTIDLEQGIGSLKAQLRRHQIETGSDKNVPDDNKTSAFKEEIAKEAEAQAAKEEARKEQLKQEEIKQEEKKSAAQEERKAEQAKDVEKADEAMKSLVASDAAKDQVDGRNAVIAKTEAGIVIKKGEMRQDEIRGENTDRQKEEIDAQEKRSRRLMDISLGPKNNNNGSAGLKATNYAIPEQDQNIVHQGSDGLVLFKAG